MFSYDDLVIFAKVVQNGGIVKAAQKLNMNYTTVGRRIKQLEENFSQALVVADRHKFLLTEFGQNLYQLIENDVQLMESMKHKIIDETKPATELSGVLNIQLPIVISLDIFTPHLHKFLQQYPNLDLHIWYQNQDVDLVKENFDVAVLNHLTNFAWQKSRAIFRVQVKLFCTKAYADKYGVPVTPIELADHVVAGGGAGRKFAKEITFTHLETDEEISIPMPRRIATNNMIHNMTLLRSNEIIICTFDHIAQRTTDIELVPVLPEYQIMKITYHLLKNPYRNTDNINAFCDFLETCLATELGEI